MPECLFATDLHGRIDRYEKLFEAIEELRPSMVFLGGDLLPHHLRHGGGDFIHDVIATGLDRLAAGMGASYPDVFAILGNDDPRIEEDRARRLDERSLWHYMHDRCIENGEYLVIGYSVVPPTPFLNKDWEKYDVSRYVPPGSVSPEDGFRSVPVDLRTIRFGTIEKDLHDLAPAEDLARAILLIHTPPHETNLDRIGNDGRMIDHVPLDLHVGSIAVRRFIERRQPLVSLHGHIHESTRLTGHWRDRIGDTHLFSAAHDGPELCLVRFSPTDLDSAERILI